MLPRTGEFDDAVGIGCAGSSRKQNLRSLTSILGADPEKERATTGCSPARAMYLIRRPGRFLSPREWCSRIRKHPLFRSRRHRHLEEEERCVQRAPLNRMRKRRDEREKERMGGFKESGVGRGQGPGEWDGDLNACRNGEFPPPGEASSPERLPEFLRYAESSGPFPLLKKGDPVTLFLSSYQGGLELHPPSIFLTLRTRRMKLSGRPPFSITETRISINCSSD